VPVGAGWNASNVEKHLGCCGRSDFQSQRLCWQSVLTHYFAKTGPLTVSLSLTKQAPMVPGTCFKRRVTFNMKRSHTLAQRRIQAEPEDSSGALRWPIARASTGSGLWMTMPSLSQMRSIPCFAILRPHRQSASQMQKSEETGPSTRDTLFTKKDLHPDPEPAYLTFSSFVGLMVSNAAVKAIGFRKQSFFSREMIPNTASAFARQDGSSSHKILSSAQRGQPSAGIDPPFWARFHDLSQGSLLLSILSLAQPSLDRTVRARLSSRQNLVGDEQGCACVASNLSHRQE
jgi:hypothetical protein